ncbi:MAG: glycosyltransferase [Candidatus Wolfebacteria bacterium]|nr:glycosyltransferase [Candidatus Wolfebacteria bacterium]
MDPLVSIIMPTYNRAKLIERAIQSILSQSFKEWELIIIDDCSTDETPQVLSSWAKKDPRIKALINKKNNYPDISKTLNRGLEESRGKYVARLDDDDYWCDPNKLKKQTEFLEKHPDYVLCGGGVIVVDGEDKELFRYLKNEKDEDIRRRALFSNPFSHTTTMFLKEKAKKVGGYGNWHYAEDWDLWLKLGEIGKFYNFPEYFTRYLMAGQNKSFVYQKAQSKMISQIITKHRKNYPNFWRAYCLNMAQYFYSFLPLFLRALLHPILSRFKRSI